MNFPAGAIVLLEGNDENPFILHRFDCPYGRFSPRIPHEGREFVNARIATLTGSYHAAPKKGEDRKGIITQVLGEITVRGGRIKRRTGPTGSWFAVPKEEARKIVSDLFNETVTKRRGGPRGELGGTRMQNPANQEQQLFPQAQPLQPPREVASHMAHHLSDSSEAPMAVNGPYNQADLYQNADTDAIVEEYHSDSDDDEQKPPAVATHEPVALSQLGSFEYLPYLQDMATQQEHTKLVSESAGRRKKRKGSEGGIDTEVETFLASPLSPRNSPPPPNEDTEISPDPSLTDSPRVVFRRTRTADGHFDQPYSAPVSPGGDYTQVRQAPQPQTLVELLPSLPLSSGIRVESAFLQRQYDYSTGRSQSCISAILRCTCDDCERSFELCHFGTTIDCPFCASDTASGDPSAKTGQSGGDGYGSNGNDTNWPNTDGHSHGGYNPGSGGGGQPFGSAPGQNNTAHSRNVACDLHSSTQSESYYNHPEQQDAIANNMKAGGDDEPMDSSATSDLPKDDVLASAFSAACTLQEEPKQTTAPDQHVASDLVVADASKNLAMGRDTSGQLSVLDEATKQPKLPHDVIAEQDFVVLPLEPQNSEGYEPREDDPDFDLSKVLHRESLPQVSSALPHDTHQSLSYDADLERAVTKYNMNVSVDMLKVKYEDVVSYMEELVQLCDGGLWRSLVYDPCDMSVYVRRLVHDEKGEELTVDVALCTQDFTWRSDNTLENVQECGDAVGRNNEMKSVPAVNQLPGIVQHVAAHRVVHAVRKYGRQVTVELATKFIGGRNNASYMDIQFPEEGKLKADFDKLSSRRKPGARVEVIDMDIMYAWIICMYLMKRNEGSSEKHVNAVRGSLLAATQGYNEGKMTMNLNYETMFLSRYRTYRDGRISWPMVLGLVTANNLKPGIADQADLVDADLASRVGTYNGRYSWRNAVALGISSLLLTVFIAAVNISIALGWSTSAVAAVVGVTDILYGGALKIVSSFLMDTENSFDMTKPDRRAAPPLQTLAEATKVLMSEFSTTHFSGAGLEFTGLVYTGKAEFSYRFSYDELFRMGFQRLCDCSGREHLLVPGKDDIVVRLDDDKNGFDVFTRVELPPNQRFAKLWIPNNYGPGEFYRLKTNAATSAPRSRPRRDGETVASVEDIKDLDDWS